MVAKPYNLYHHTYPHIHSLDIFLYYPLAPKQLTVDQIRSETLPEKKGPPAVDLSLALSLSLYLLVHSYDG